MRRRAASTSVKWINLCISTEEDADETMMANRLASSVSNIYHKISLAPIYETYSHKIEFHVKSEQSSPFRRWASGSGGSALGPRSYRRPGSLVATSDHDMFSKCAGERGAECAGAVSRWSLGLDQLLADPAGAAAFAAFLAKEFSAENIKFWWACERYRAGAASAERAQLAHDIWSRHLATGAPEPVNVDSQARAAAERALQHAPHDLFASAQKQIFTLMKFDSYPRFLQSDIHAECARAELCGQPSPYSPHSPTPTKLKKSISNAEERRRGSLLARLRGSSKDRPAAAASAPATPAAPLTPDDHSRRPSFSGVMRPGAQLCKVVLPDAATSIVPVDSTTVSQLVNRLLEKRAIHCSSYDVIVQGDTRPVDVTAPSSSLAGREVAVERRVTFRLELPGHRVSVRTRPNKRLAAVLRPALQHYSLPSEDIRVTRAHNALSLEMLVQDLDGARLQVHLTPAPATKQLKPRAEEPTTQPLPVRPPTNQQPPPSALINRQTKQSCHTLDEITNRVFEEVLQGKGELQISPTDNSMKSENCSSEHSSGAGRSVVAKLRAGVHVHSAAPALPSLAASPAEFAEHLQLAQQRLRPPRADPSVTPSPSPAAAPAPPVPAARSLTKPCPAVRTSLARDRACNGLPDCAADVAAGASAERAEPPPLPPKPKVLPTKPSNWGNSVDSTIIQDTQTNVKLLYLDQPTSSFV